MEQNRVHAVVDGGVGQPTSKVRRPRRAPRASPFGSPSRDRAAPESSKPLSFTVTAPGREAAVVVIQLRQGESATLLDSRVVSELLRKLFSLINANAIVEGRPRKGGDSGVAGTTPNEASRRAMLEREVASFTPRELEVLYHLLRGRSEKEIAVNIGNAPNTVHVHVKSIYRRLGVCTRAEMMALWINQPGLRD